MAMSSSAKKKLGFLGLALVALAIDRGLVFSGGSEASAQAGVATTPQAQSASPVKQKTTAEAAAIADKLDEIRKTVNLSETDRNAFRLPEVLAPRQPEAIESLDLPGSEPQPIAAPQPDPLPNFEVSSIIANSTGTKMAVINGTPIRLGETKQGITLIEVSARTATIGYDGRTVELRLND